MISFDFNLAIIFIILLQDSALTAGFDLVLWAHQQLNCCIIPYCLSKAFSSDSWLRLGLWACQQAERV